MLVLTTAFHARMLPRQTQSRLTLAIDTDSCSLNSWPHSNEAQVPNQANCPALLSRRADST